MDLYRVCGGDAAASHGLLSVMTATLKTSEIRPTLTSLLQQAHATAGISQFTIFESGLRLQLMVHEGFTYLHLSRDDRFPSIAEYESILRQWPFPIVSPDPKAVSHSGRYYLTTVLPLPSTPQNKE